MLVMGKAGIMVQFPGYDKQFFFFPEVFRPGLRPTQPPIQCTAEELSPGIKWQGCKVEPHPLSKEKWVELQLHFPQAFTFTLHRLHELSRNIFEQTVKMILNFNTVTFVREQ
jgi:hypothetical protein